MFRLPTMAVATISAVAFAQIASAADLPVKPPSAVVAPAYSWTGWYVGLNAGYAWGNADATAATSCAVPAGTGYFCDAGTGAAGLARGASIVATGSGSINPNGFTGGIQAGANWQTGSVVFGGELDFSAFNLTGSRTASALYPGLALTHTATSTIDTDWLFTARARLGWAVSNVLIYATGGLAVTEAKISTSMSDNQVFGGFSGAVLNVSNSGVRTGWAVGGGVESALSRNWTVKAEYLYVDLGSISTTGTVTHGGFPGLTNPYTVSADLKANITRVGVNYRF